MRTKLHLKLSSAFPLALGDLGDFLPPSCSIADETSGQGKLPTSERRKRLSLVYA